MGNDSSVSNGQFMQDVTDYQTKISSWSSVLTKRLLVL
jgi:hypothetical protein